MSIIGKGKVEREIKLGSTLMKDVKTNMRKRESESKFFFLNPSGKPFSRKSIYDIVLKVVEGA